MYLFGDEVAKAFSDNEEIISEISVDMWKAGIALQRKWVAVTFDKTYPEKYAAKIQKYDASYALPQENRTRNIIGAILKFFSH